MVNREHQKGFTLLEVLVSATIVAVLTIIGVVSYSSVNKRSRDVKRKSDIEQIRSALEMYRSDNGGYPAVNSVSWGFTTELSSDLVSTYMPAIPSDPQTTSDYHYYYAATNYDATTLKYYGYCICGRLDTLTVETSTCLASDIPTGNLPGGTPPLGCNYGLKSP